MHVHPRRRARRFVQGALTLGLAGAVSLAVAAPARADDGQDGTTTTETPAQNAQRETDAAIELAFFLLSNPACNSIVSGDVPAGGVEAFDLLALLTADRVDGSGGGIVDKYDRAKGADDTQILAEAPVGAGASGKITLYKGFHDVSFSDYGHFTPLEAEIIQQSFDRYGGPPDATGYRALVILHELAHLTGFLERHKGYEAAGAHYDLLLFEDCLRMASRCGSVGVGGPPVPCPESPDTSGASGTGGVVIVPGDGGGTPTTQEPLPESDDPTIDFGSDEPTVRGEDGSIIDGGEIGGAYPIDDGGFDDPGGYPDYYDDGDYGYDDYGFDDYAYAEFAS